MVAAALSILTDSVALFFLITQGSNAGFVFRDTVSGYSRALLLLGLVALYGRQFEAVGIPGLVGFLEASVGTVLESLELVWAAVLASLGWVLFGAASLYAEVYSTAATILLIVGAGLSGVVNALIVSGLLEGSPVFGASAMVIDIIFNTAIARLGFGLLSRRD